MVTTVQSAAQKQAPRWQDVRAKAIDATFDADRRRVGERVALAFPWLFLIVLGALNNLNPNPTTESSVIIDFALFPCPPMNAALPLSPLPADHPATNST